MAAIGKVTALLTRQGSRGTEVCVFDHPRAGVQLPAGTLLPGEDASVGAQREAFEETGLDNLQFKSEAAILPASQPGFAITSRASQVGDQIVPAGRLARVLTKGSREAQIEVDGIVGIVELEALCLDAVRYVIHFVIRDAAPDEWFVMTPDGGGHCWRCHWLPVEDAHLLTTGQQLWLDVARRQLQQASHPRARSKPVFDPDAETDLTIEIFWAPPWSGTRALVSWLDPVHAPPDDLVQRAEAVAITDEGEIVAVAEDNRQLWTMPGGRRERGESVEQTLRRELLEEACVQVETSEPVGFQRFRHLTGVRTGTVSTDAMFWARVGVEPFEPRFETSARRLLPLATARDLPLWANPITHRLLTRATNSESSHHG